MEPERLVLLILPVQGSRCHAYRTKPRVSNCHHIFDDFGIKQHENSLCHGIWWYGICQGAQNQVRSSNNKGPAAASAMDDCSTSAYVCCRFDNVQPLTCRLPLARAQIPGYRSDGPAHVQLSSAPGAFLSPVTDTGNQVYKVFALTVKLHMLVSAHGLQEDDRGLRESL